MQTPDIDIEAISIVNLPAYDISMKTDCESVAKMWRILIVCVLKFCVFLWKVRKGLTCRDNKIVNAPEVLRSTHISEPVEVELNFT